ncbi:MAG: N(5)-(carboxyethyl)ornithine synthase [Eubacteriales bacterium]|nr:N(5)-(carboxyethyl)ornithine synthase [Eubacteriales bacterium]
MKTIGYVISHKNHEQRRALIPKDAEQIQHRSMIVVEHNYGDALGYSDDDYLRAGVSVAPRKQVLSCDALVDVKLGDSDFMSQLTPRKTLIGWSHILQKPDFTDAAIAGQHSVLAWENIMENGRYLFYRNRELAGETAILHAFCYYGRMPYDCSVAIIGNGMTAHGAFRILIGLGARVDIYTRKMESLFRENMTQYDVIVNCVRWDTCRDDRLIYRSDLRRMKQGSMIIDVSCDACLEIETSRATTFDDPVYSVDGVLHYSVDNTPAMAYRTVSEVISRSFSPYIDAIVTNKPVTALEQAYVIRGGMLLDEECIAFRSRLEQNEA